MQKASEGQGVVADVGGVDLVVLDVPGEDRVGGVGGTPGYYEEQGQAGHHVGVGQTLSESPHENTPRVRRRTTPSGPVAVSGAIVNDNRH